MPDPIKWKAGFEPQPTTPEPSTPSFMDRLSGLVPAGIRVGSGILAGEGGPLGAAISAGGEGLAELAEDPTSLPSWKRMALEGGLGAIPLGKVFKVGRVLESGLKSGALAGVGEAGREYTKGEQLNPTKIAMNAGIGGLTGGALSKFLGVIGSNAPKAAEAAAKEYEVVPTAQTGPGAGVIKDAKKGGIVPTNQPRPIKSEVPSSVTRTRKSTEIPYRMEAPKGTEIPEDLAKAGTEGRVPYSSEQPAPYRSSAKAAVKAETPKPSPLKSILNRQFAYALGEKEKAAQEAADKLAVQTARENAGLTQPTHSSSSTIQGPGEKFTTQYSQPSEEASDLDEAIRRAEGGPKSPTPPPPDTVVQNPATASEVNQAPVGEVAPVISNEPPPSVPAPVSEPETPLGKILKPRKSRSKKTTEGFNKAVEDTLSTEPTPVAAAPPVEAPQAPPSKPGVLARFFRTKKGATGLNYRQAQNAAEAGDKGSVEAARDAHLIELGKNPEGPLSTDPNGWIQNELKALDKMKGQKGEISPELLKFLTGATGAAIGAPIGAANSEDDDKLGGALTGAAIGGGIGYGVPGAINAVKDPGNFLTKLGKFGPAAQRANLLTSGHGLAANAYAGPYGSALFGSIEKGLSGDPRGYEALKHLSPVNFMRKALPKFLGGGGESMFDQAAGLIGRAEGTSLNAAATPTEKLLSVPGTMMTSGDLAARDILEKGGGFLPEETRQMTLTNEPFSPSMKKVANLSKGSPLLQYLFPFSRTTANIAEQGTARLPGVGFLAHRAMESGGKVPDSLRTKLIQQGMGTAIGTGAGVIGANIDDPENAKIARKYISNFGGQYALPASIGFTVGQALGQGKDATAAGLSDISNSIPLPTTRPLQDLFTTGADLFHVATGDKNLGGPEFDPKGNLKLGDVRVPHGFYPSAIRDLATSDINLPSFGEDEQAPDINQSVPPIRWR